MGKPPESEGLLILGFLVLYTTGSNAQINPEYGCPSQENILPCRCSTRDMEFQIWCSHSELPKVLEGLKAVSRLVLHPIDELILENNNLPSLPGKVFASLRVLRLMLRNNRLERVSSSWLEGLNDSLLELFIVEPDLRSLPDDSLESLQGLEAITLQSKAMKRLPSFTALPKLRYLQVNSPSLIELKPQHFRDLPSLEQLHIFGSRGLVRLEAGLLRDLPRLTLVNVSDCGVHWIHPRAMIGLPELKEISLVGNAIVDAAMVGYAVMDLPSLSVLNLNRNLVDRIGESSFVDLPMLTRLSLSENRITEIFSGAFQRVPMLRILDLNHNFVHRVHADFFYPQRGGNSLEEIWFIDNDLVHVSELRAILEALPKLKYLDISYNHLMKIPFGSLGGHPTLERLHLDHNRLNFLQRDSFAEMPALRELRLRNNSLSNMLEVPFWNLPALKGLDLSGNYFRHIESRLLANLPNLRRLDVSGNAIALIEPDSFLRTPALEHVNISGNALSVLHPLTFRHLSNLYELDLGWNRLLEVIPGLPKNLEHLYLSMNRLVALPPLSSQALALPLLKTLDISANGIERIASGALSKLPNLRRLNLGYNALTMLEEESFEGLSKLEQLDLRYNRLVAIHGRSLRPLRRLIELNLRDNRLEVIRPDLLHDNTRLQRLDFSRNNLAQIPHAAFSNTRDLRELYASHNSLTELPHSLHGLTALEVLDLSFNKLNILSPETLSSLSALLELKLVRNRIKELREGAFVRLPRLTLIDLENNDLHVIERNAVRSLPELQALRLGKNRIQVIPSGAFSELPMLQSAELQENRISEVANNAFINVPHLLLLNLSHNLVPSLHHMGLESLRSLEVLDLSNNRLTRISSDNLAAMEWLVELKMDNNRICTIQGSPFDGMPRLRVLSLKNNKMASVSENAFKRLRSNIAILDIDGNPLACTCGMLWLRGWLQQASADGPRCADGSLFKEVRLSKKDCQRERHIEPVYPGCEAEMINTASATSSGYSYEQVQPWMNMKQQGIQGPPPGMDYLYDDYEDSVQGNFSEYLQGNASIQNAPTLSSVAAVAAPNRSQLSANHFHKKNNTKLPWNPPSPSSSGFTFFGVPLPSLNFNLWGNLHKKSQRKEDNTHRPGRSRNRFQPPTEPVIHKGGFIPLPKGEGGFVPIVDRQNTSTSAKNDNLKSWGNTTVVKVVEEHKRQKHSNYTIAKIERTTGLKNRDRIQTKEREELSTVTTVPDSTSLPTSVETKKTISQLMKHSSTAAISVDPSLEAEETAVSTEIYNGESLEVGSDGAFSISDTNGGAASRITWTTPKSLSRAVVKETVTATVEVFASKTKDNIKSVDKKPTTKIIATSKNEVTYNNITNQPTFKTPEATTEANRNMEASALSAFLAPGGQIPIMQNSRPPGRPTITKVSSPFLGTSTPRSQYNNRVKTVANSSSIKVGSQSDVSIKETTDSIEENPFSWYFQHYNDTDLEPFVGIAYSGVKNMCAISWYPAYFTATVFFAKLLI